MQFFVFYETRIILFPLVLCNPLSPDEEKILLVLSTLNGISNFTMDFHVAKTMEELFSDSAQSRLYRPLSSCICKRRDDYAQYISSRHIHPNGDWSIAVRASISNIGLHMHLAATALLSDCNAIRSHRRHLIPCEISSQRV